MQAQTHSPAGIFGHHIRYVVPLFQRPYVWNEAEQWQPLWDDVRNLAERLLEAPPVAYGVQPVPPHFLGAIVVDQQLIPAGFIAVRHVVDGQQRLTTLQLLLDAAQWVVEQFGAAMDAQALRVLVLNDPAIAQQPDEVFKVWPTDRDQDAFRAAMDNDTVVSAALAQSRVAQAHAFFVEQITDWADPSGDPDKVTGRLNALVRTLRDYLKVVVIDLEPGDNAQVIFETLNHRGTPLLAADLVKNFVFQIAEAQGADIHDLYAKYWRPLDSDYWRQLVAQGRLYRPRIDVFLNYWLTMKLLREVPTDRVFTDFRDHVATSQTSVAELLAELAGDASVYEQMEKAPADTVEGAFYYRVIRALDSAAVGPFLLWVLRWDEHRMPLEQRYRALQALESWMVRRALVRATAKGVNNVIVDLMKALDRAGPDEAGAAVEDWLAAQSADARYWPSDAAVHASLDDLPLYTAITRPRLRMLLEAIEDSMHGPYGEGQPCPRGLTVEHVMPQAWREHWGADIDGDAAAGIARDRLVQTLGNLTLVNGKFNSVLSNRPWTDSSAIARGLGGEGKRSYLLAHSQLSLNSTLVAGHEEDWTEDTIHARGTGLTDRLIAIWPRPVEAMQQDVPTPTTTETQLAAPLATQDDDDDIEAPAHEGKYRALWAWLRDQDRHEIRLTFAEIEQIIGMALPPSARNHLPHWYGYAGTALGRAIRDAGWKASQVNLTDERVVFLPNEA